MEKKKVLVIDDEQIVLDSVIKILSSGPYAVDTTLSGQDGIRRVLKNDYDLVLTDVRMPDISGKLVLHEIKRLKPSLPVVIITGFSSIGSARETMKMGASDYLEKPFSPDELLRVDRRFDDAARVADVAVLKVGPLGGVAATLAVAQRVGLPVVISSALDSSIGLAAGLAAACTLPRPPLACGLGTGALLLDDTCPPLLPDAGRMRFTGYPQPDFEPVAEDVIDAFVETHHIHRRHRPTGLHPQAGEAGHPGDATVVAIGKVAVPQIADVQTGIECAENVVPL